MPGDALPATARCFHCGERHDPTLAACPDCATSFRRLCACDHQVNAYAERCDACGLLQHPPVYRPPARRRRVVGLTVLACVILGLTTLGLMDRTDARLDAKPWELKQKAQARILRRDLANARKDLEAVTARYPRDAEAWYMLAVVDRELKLDPELYRASALRAVELNPRLPQPMSFLAEDHMRRGELAEARRWAARAVTLEAAGPRTWWLVGELELQRTQPDTARALSAFEKVYEDPTLRDAALLARLAALRIRVLGFAPRERFPDGVRRALDEAEEAFARLDEAERNSLDLLPLRIEIQLALGSHPAARGLATRALELAGEDADPLVRARLLALRGRALFQSGEQEPARIAFAEALALSPTGPAIAYVTDFLDSVGSSDVSDALLAGALANDPEGHVAGALARRALGKGDVEEARRSLDEARERAPEDLDLGHLEAAVLQAEGDFAGARAVYTAIAEGSQHDDSVRYDLALLCLREPLSLTDREAAARKALEQLVADADLRSGDAAYHATVGALCTSLGQDDEAVAALEAATRLQPWNPRMWFGLGEALSAAVEIEDAQERASEAYARSASLRPHDPGLVARVAWAALRAGDPAQAAGTCSVYLAAHPDDHTVRRRRSEAYRRLGHWKSLAEDLQYLFDGGAADPADLELMVGAYARVGRLARVPEFIRRARAAGDVDRAHVLERALALERGEEPPAGASPDGAELPVSRALALFSAGESEEARTVLRSILAARPGNPDAVRVLVLSLFTGPGATPDRIDECRAAVAHLQEGAGLGLAVFLDGCLLLAEGSVEAAARTLRRASDARPNDPMAAFLYGQALLSAGHLHASLPAFRRAALLDRRMRSPLPAAVSERITVVAARIGSLERRERLLREALSLDPANVQATEALYGLFSARRDFPRAAQVAEAALRHASAHPELERRLRGLAVTARLANRDLEGALVHLERLEADGQDAVLLASLRGWVLVESGQHDRARRVFEEAIAADPRSQAATLGLVRLLVRIDNIDTARELTAAWHRAGPADSAVTHFLIDQLARAGKMTEALEEAREAVLRDAEDALALGQLIWLHELEGQSEAALGVARAAIATATDGSRAERELVFSELELRLRRPPPGPLAVAQRIIADASVDAPTRRRAALVRCEALLAGGDVAAAREACDGFRAGWVDDRPVDPLDIRIEHRVRFVQAVLDLGEGNTKAAGGHLLRCLALSPSHHSAMNNLAWVLAQEPASAARGLVIARKATAAVPKNPDYWDTQGVCAEAAEDLREAERCYRIALEFFAREDPQRPETRGATALALARLLRRTGRGDSARKLVLEIQQFAPGTAAARDAEALLRR